ncbi:MAG: tRNA nucleotidyltransferase, partial [Bacteroidetes bacterium]|nr:tRNA nucleotidyltransferase [Bacteroidota bacterium]
MSFLVLKTLNIDKFAKNKKLLKEYFSEPVFKLLAKVAADLKTPAYIVGGYVRDLALGRQSTDIDIVVVGSGIEFAKEFACKTGKNTKVSVFT